MPPGTQQHRVGEHWSAANPVPTIQKFMQHLESEKEERKAHEEEVTAKEIQARQEREARGENLDEATAHKNREIPKGKTRMVTDPTTGKNIEVEDLDEESMEVVKNPTLTVPNANLGKETHVKTHPEQEFSEYKEAQDVTAPPDPVAEGTTSDVPIRGEKTNVLFHPTPAISFKPMFETLERRAIGLCVGFTLGILFVGRMFGGSLWGLIPLAACIVSGVWLWMQEVIRSGRELEWSSEQLRGQTATANLLPESVEWMNNFLGVFWGLLNPEMLAPIGDTIEDIMQASSPGVIENVRVAEIDQGSNPLRILSMRALPDNHVEHLQENIHEENKKKDPQEAAAVEEGGSYYNLEASFAYHAKPSTQSASSKARNMHMQLIFYLGSRGLFGIPFPVFVELIEMVGTVRLRVQMMPEAPFLKEVTFSLVGIPHVRAGCMPMVRGGVNILNLPLISNFVNYAIGTACSMFAAPKSMTMDLGMMLKGDDIVKETIAIGIMWVRIHRAVGLSKQDTRGSFGGGSDPYINLSFSKYGKPMYCTRVITDDLNPVWEETAALLVTPELIKADESLSVELWDSDRTTADDIVGKVELPIREMLRHPGKMYPQVSKLQGLSEGSEMPGELHWEVGFFGKPKLRPELRTDGKKKDLPENLKDVPEFQDDKGTIATEEEDAITRTPPDPLWPSGIVSIVVHQIVNLQVADIKGSHGNRRGREYEPARRYGENTEESGGDLPSSYCKILLNDTLVYRTRAKAVSSKPIFNAGTERFVRDWRSAVVTVTVRDQRYREHDPILGVVPLKLTDVLQNSSQATRWYPLDGGVGFGRIRISLLLRHVETKLPPQMLGWDVGTFEFTSDEIKAPGFGHYAKIKMRTGGSTGKITRHVCHANGNDIRFDLTHHNLKKQARMPVKHRYRSPLVFEFYTHGKHHATGYAVLWLQHLVDNEETPVDIPIWSTKNGERLTQNYITEQNWEAKRVPGLEDLKEIARLQFTGRFSAGIDETHERFVVDNHSRETYETWETCVAEGVRTSNVTADVPEEIERLHERSLVEGRDVLKHADAKERKHWIDKQGVDWSGAFGDDPVRHCRGHGHEENGEEDDDDDNSSSESPQARSPTTNRTSEGTNRSAMTGTTGTTDSQASTDTKKEAKAAKKANKRNEERQQRGMMQWKPARNVVFARDETKFALRKVREKIGGGLSGREPDIETET